MPRPYSADLRRAALRACARNDGPRRRIARRYGIGESTLYGWLRQEREEDRHGPKPHAGGRPRTIDAVAFEAHTGQKVSPPMVCKALKRLGLGRKKRRSGPSSRTGRTWPRSAPPTATRPPRPSPPT